MITTNSIERATYPADKIRETEIILFSRASVIVFAVALIGEVLGGAALLLGA
jgi:hypothetical protein